MFWCLNGPAVGVEVPLPDLIELARRHGFAGVEFGIAEAQALATERGTPAVRQLFADAGIRPTSWLTPFDWRQGAEEFTAGLERLPAFADLSADLGCLRATTSVRPGSDTLPEAPNRALHVDRLGAIAEVLDKRGISFGLEFIAPKTLRDEYAFPFVHTLKGMREEIIGQIGTSNVGIVLDAFHWFTSHGTVADIESLQAKDIVHVHINDAVAGRSADEQLDLDRRLPLTTGLIDLKAFLAAVAKLGYDGGVAVEPFDPSLATQTPEQAVAAVAESLRRSWALLG
jgi:sugar phosphate isomerase/epimerase